MLLLASRADQIMSGDSAVYGHYNHQKEVVM